MLRPAKFWKTRQKARTPTDRPSDAPASNDAGASDIMAVAMKIAEDNVDRMPRKSG